MPFPADLSRGFCVGPFFRQSQSTARARLPSGRRWLTARPEPQIKMRELPVLGPPRAAAVQSCHLPMIRIGVPIVTHS